MTSPDYPQFWDQKYKSDQAGWDLKSPAPVFEDLLNLEQFIKPGKILIPGRGKGYDAVLAAKKGYEVYALDFSAEAVDFAKKLAEKEKVKINFLVEDIFKLDSSYNNYFDYVYDYVMFCAILPARREEYASKVASLLKPGGQFVIFLFPVEDRQGGPPFAVNVIEFYDLFSRHLQLKFSSKEINSIKPRKGREVLQIYLKKVTEK